MDFREFERRARRAFEEIPEAYRKGVDGLTVSRETLSHPTLPEVYTLGQCLTEEHPSDYGSPDTVRSIIALYWGSFDALAQLDPEFDWEDEMWETLTHELRHHLESLAGDDALEGVDYAADEMFKREEGLPFDPWYYERGEDLGGGVFAVEGRYHLEQIWSEEDFGEATELEFAWRGPRYRIERPAELGDVHFVRISGPDAFEPFDLVIVKKRRWWEGLTRLAGGSRAIVFESDATAVPVDTA